MTDRAQIVTIPCLGDNYAFLLHDPESGRTALVDAPEAGPIRAELDARGWTLSDILITHHHDDHIQAVAALRGPGGARIWGAGADRERLPRLDHELAEGDAVRIGGLSGHVIEVPGHTIGHIAFHFPDAGAVFTADSLMALGCGRLFEGTAEQMWDSLQKLAALPPETLVCSGHEYTMSNAKFALSIEPQNAALISRIEKIKSARAADSPTVPSKLADELATNPFLRAHLDDLKSGIGMSGEPDVEVFAEIRARKDRF